MKKWLWIAVFLTSCHEPEIACNAQYAGLPYSPVPSISGYSGTWVKNPNPLIDISADQNLFDPGYTSTPKVVYDNGYRVYYTGGVLVDRPGREMFGLALSSDLTTAEKYLGQGDRGSLFNLGPVGYYDHDRQWGMGTVLNDNGLWKMWTIGDSDGGQNHIARVGYATSHDGFVWTKHYTTGFAGAVFEDMGCDDNGVLAFSVVKETDGYYAWYYTFQSNAIRLAYSSDGITWGTLGVINISAVTGLGNVIKDGNIYYLTATRPDFSEVLVFVSTDRINWSQYDSLGISPEYTWQSGWMAFPYLLKNGDAWYLFYTAADKHDDGLSGRVGVAVLTN